MSLEAIRKSILGEASSKAKAELSGADAEADSIIKEAQDRAKAILKQADEEAKREEERMRLEASAGLDTESNIMVIEAKGKVVEQALSQVRNEVEKRIRSEGMEKILKSGIKQFGETIGDSDFVVRTSKKNAPLVRGKRVEYADVDGFILSTPDKKVSLNATLDTIIEDSMDEIRKMVAGEIFSGSTERKIERATSAMEKKSEKSIVKEKVKRARTVAKTAKPAKKGKSRSRKQGRRR